MGGRSAFSLSHCSCVNWRRMPSSMRAFAFSSSARAWATRSICARSLFSSGGSADDQGLHDCFFFLQRGELIDQLEPVGVENVVHLFLLIVGQAEPLNEVGIVPPASRRDPCEASPRTSRPPGPPGPRRPGRAGPLVRRTVRTARGGLLSKTGRSEQEGYKNSVAKKISPFESVLHVSLGRGSA